MPHIDLTTTSQSMATLDENRQFAMTTTDATTIVYVMSTDTSGVTSGGVLVQVLTYTNPLARVKDTSAFLYYVVHQGSAPTAAWVDADAAPGFIQPYWTVSGPSAGTPWTASHTLVAGELAPFDTSGSAYTATLPSAVGIAGQRCGVKDATGHAATHNITVNPAVSSGQTLDGASSVTISTNFACGVYVSNGVNWIVEH